MVQAVIPDTWEVEAEGSQVQGTQILSQSKNVRWLRKGGGGKHLPSKPGHLGSILRTCVKG